MGISKASVNERNIHHIVCATKLLIDNWTCCVCGRKMLLMRDQRTFPLSHQQKILVSYFSSAACSRPRLTLFCHGSPGCPDVDRFFIRDLMFLRVLLGVPCMQQGRRLLCQWLHNLSLACIIDESPLKRRSQSRLPTGLSDGGFVPKTPTTNCCDRTMVPDCRYLGLRAQRRGWSFRDSRRVCSRKATAQHGAVAFNSNGLGDALYST